MFVKNYHLHWIVDRANVLSKYLICFFNFGRGFCISFSMLFPEAPASCDKKILKWLLLHCTSICMSSKILSLIFKILFKLEILIFLFFVVSFLVKSSFSDEKTPAVKSETYFSREDTKV